MERESRAVICLADLTAGICHEVNRVYCQSIGDSSQPKWDDAPDWQKESAVKGVRFVLSSKGTVTPKDLHASWSDEKLKTGWKYGVVKNVDKKEHPCLVEYDDLPEHQKLKDEYFNVICQVVKKLLDTIPEIEKQNP